MRKKRCSSSRRMRKRWIGEKVENLKEVQPGAPMRDGAEREWRKNGGRAFEQPYQGLNSLIRVKRICARAALKCLQYQIG